MILKSLSLTSFRNYSKADFSFSPQTTLIIGPNTAGKTNLLEAIYYLATGKSFRARYDRETIRSGKDVCHLQGRNGDGDVKLELSIALKDNQSGNGSQKRFKVNGVGKRLSDFAGNLRAVYFGPEEILLVTGSPSRRRKYLDSVLVQVDREYARTLSEYEKVLRQRNRLLSLIREGEQSREQLDLWDPKLLELGSVLSRKRQEMLKDFNGQLGDNLFLEFDQSGPRPLSEMVKFREREIGAGMTLWGPHRDDFGFVQMDVAARPRPTRFATRSGRAWRASPSLGDDGADQGSAATPSSPRVDLSVYGSRGEQRLAVLHLKLAELEFLASRSDQRPILLLDDIFSELDENNRGQVLELLGKQQTIVTATDIDQIDGERLGELEVLKLKRCQGLRP